MCYLFSPQWEELLEQIFDYDAMRSARIAFKADGKLRGRRRFQPWRDWLEDYLDKRIEQTRRAKEANVLTKLEQANLTARGLSEAQAKQQAHELAATMVLAAQELRQPVLTPLTMESAHKKRERIKAMLVSAAWLSGLVGLAILTIGLWFGRMPAGYQGARTG